MFGRNVYGNLWTGLKKAVRHSIKVLEKNKEADYFYIHFKETDLSGHDGLVEVKKKMIEYIDRDFIRYLVRRSEREKFKLIVTGDHSTPCSLKRHSSDPVPVLFYDGTDVRSEGKTFGETNCRRGRIGRMVGFEVFEKTGFLK